LNLFFVSVKKLIPLFPQLKNFVDLRNDKGQYHQAQKNDGRADNRHGPPVVGRYVFKTKHCVPPWYKIESKLGASPPLECWNNSTGLDKRTAGKRTVITINCRNSDTFKYLLTATAE
jgi:hypothetical protein